MASNRTVEKAVRLHEQGRVREIPAPRSFTVQGDHGTYHVVISHDVASAYCTCPADGDCSHITAALLYIRNMAAATA